MSQAADLLIIGGGPAGLSAAIYGARAGLDSVVLERGIPGGQIATVDSIENYPGFPEGVSGAELGEKMRLQAERLGARFHAADVDTRDLDLASRPKTAGGLTARAVIVATGARPRKLGIPGEDTFGGRGVSYCATCDGAFFRGRRVAVIGGGDSAITEALYLSKLAAKVVVVHRRDTFRAAPSLVERLRDRPNIEVKWSRVPVAIEGGGKVECLVLREAGGKAEERLETDGVFVYVGMDPVTDFVRGKVDLDQQGYVVTDEALRTRVPLVYAAGDVRAKGLRQVVTAVADGALAATTAERDLSE